MQQHIVTNTPRSADEIRPIRLTPFFAKILLRLTTIDIPVSSKIQIFWGEIVPSLRRASFNLQKMLSKAGRLNPTDQAKLVDSGLRSDNFLDLLRNPRSQSFSCGFFLGPAFRHRNLFCFSKFIR